LVLAENGKENGGCVLKGEVDNGESRWWKCGWIGGWIRRLWQVKRTEVNRRRRDSGFGIWDKQVDCKLRIVEQ
jgi:hypothetical protein